MKKGIWLLAMALGLAACGDDRSPSPRTGSAVGGSAMDFVAGPGEGVDRRMSLTLEVAPAMAARGLTVTLGKSRGVGARDASIYVIASHSFTGTLVARALDAEGSEIGRALVEVAMAADDAQYVDFTFSEEMDSQRVRSYALSAR